MNLIGGRPETPLGVGEASCRRIHLLFPGVQGHRCWEGPLSRRAPGCLLHSALAHAQQQPQGPCPSSCSHSWPDPSASAPGQFNAFVCLFVKVGGSESSPDLLWNVSVSDGVSARGQGPAECVAVGEGVGGPLRAPGQTQCPRPPLGYASTHPFLQS